jgi:hypothetical protein
MSGSDPDICILIGWESDPANEIEASEQQSLKSEIHYFPSSFHGTRRAVRCTPPLLLRVNSV